MLNRAAFPSPLYTIRYCCSFLNTTRRIYPAPPMWWLKDCCKISRWASEYSWRLRGIPAFRSISCAGPACWSCGCLQNALNTPAASPLSIIQILVNPTNTARARHSRSFGLMIRTIDLHLAVTTCSWSLTQPPWVTCLNSQKIYNKNVNQNCYSPLLPAGLAVRCAPRGQTATTFVVVVPLRRSIPAWEISFKRSIAAARAAGLFWASGLSGSVNGWWKFGGCTWRPTSSGSGRPANTRSISWETTSDMAKSGRAFSSNGRNRIVHDSPLVLRDVDANGSEDSIVKYS